MTRVKLFMAVAALVIAGTGGCGGEKDQTKLYNEAFARALSVDHAVPLGATAKITQTIKRETTTVDGRLVSWKITLTCTGDSVEDTKACQGHGDPANCKNTPQGSVCTWSKP
jgi:hypothetical protein